MKRGALTALPIFVLTLSCSIFAADAVEISTQVKDSQFCATGQETAGFKPFYVQSDDTRRNHFVPSGWMGDVSDIKISAAYIDNRPELGKTCLKITYLARGRKEWAGVYWQHPANNWGDRQGGHNLIGAGCLSFWARGEKGGEKISEFKIGGLTGQYPDSDMAWIGPVKLKKDWVQYK